MSKLSNYIFNININLKRNLINIEIIEPNNNTYAIGNLVIREYYNMTKKGYTYCKETMIISNIINNDYVGLQLQTVISINGKTALVDPNIHTLFMVGDKWINTLDEIDLDGTIVNDPTSSPDLNNGEVRCESLGLIRSNQAIKRTYISQNKFYEKNGIISNEVAPPMEIPAWC